MSRNPYQPERERTAKRGILPLLVLLAATALVLCPKPHAVHQAVSCLVYTPGSDETSTAEVQLDGTYWSHMIGSGQFTGTVYLTDENGKKTTGGTLTHIPFSRLQSGYSYGPLFYFDERTSEFGSLGSLFWNVSKNQFLIVDDSSRYIFYPAGSLTDLETQLNQLNMGLPWQS